MSANVSYNFSIGDFDFGTYYPNLAGIAFIAVLSFVGVTGNLALIGVVLINRPLRTLPNVLILNLAIGDFFYIICVGPAWIEFEYDPTFDLPAFVCKLKHYMTLVSQGACVFSLTVLSFERYSVIVRGMQTRQSRKKLRTFLAVGAVWSLSFLLAIPAAIIADKTYFEYPGMEGGWGECYSSTDDSSYVAFALYKALLFYLVPLLLIAAFYSKVAVALLKSATSLQGQDSHTSNTRQQANRQRLAMICLAITAFFAVFWLPHYAFTLWSHLDKSEFFMEEESSSPDADFENFRIVQYFVALINSSMSPWLLFVLSTTHRRHFVKPCKRCMPKGSLVRQELGSPSNGISMSNTNAYRSGF